MVEMVDIVNIVNIVKITIQVHFWGKLLNIVKICNITTLHWPKVAHIVTLLKKYHS